MKGGGYIVFSFSISSMIPSGCLMRRTEIAGGRGRGVTGDVRTSQIFLPLRGYILGCDEISVSKIGSPIYLQYFMTTVTPSPPKLWDSISLSSSVSKRLNS